MAGVRKPRLGIVLIASLLGSPGCQRNPPAPTKPAFPFRGITVVVGTTGDLAVLPGLASQRGEWTATRGGEITVQSEPVPPKQTAALDVIVFRGDQLGDLVDAGALLPIPESLVRPPAAVPGPDAPPAGSRPAEAPPDPVQFTDIAPSERDQAGKYGSERYALPYGGSALVLVYQRDAFEREANHAAAKKAKLELKPPATWEELDALAKFFQGRDWNGDGTPEFGMAVALGTDLEGVADAAYLARAASVGLHHDQYSFLFDSDTMAPRIDSPPFVEALSGLAAWKAFGPPKAEDLDAPAARRLFSEGRAALLIDRAEQVARWGNGPSIGVAPLPGSVRVYEPIKKVWETRTPPNRPFVLPYGGGWLVGVNARAAGARREAALDFARYLIAPEIASRVRFEQAFPMLAVRTTLIAQGPPDPSAAKGVDARQWADAVTRTLLAERVFPSLRIPEAEAYLTDLADARLAAVRGASAGDALKKVAQAWAKRTQRLGTERQLWHYRRSLNSLITAPEPPPR